MVKCTSLKGDIFYIGCIYNSPSNSKVDFINGLGCFCEEFENIIDKMYLLGDMNIDFANFDHTKELYERVITRHGFPQLITTPTRIGETSATILYHALCSSFSSADYDLISLTS